MREWSDNFLADHFTDTVLLLAETEQIDVRFDGQHRVDFTMNDEQRAAVMDIAAHYRYLQMRE